VLPDLPVSSHLPALADALARAGVAVLEAPPGAGKTTLVPLRLLAEPWLRQGRILLLEPRRLAARAAARRMARLLDEEPGRTVGFRIRGDSAVTKATRIEVVTEGILTRMLQRDPALEGVALVIFDEFHERSVHADLGLALCLQGRALLRPDLRVLVMSATLDGEAVARLLGDAPRITAPGRSFPVETRYLPPRHDLPLDAAVVSAVRLALAEAEGDVLAFLPGQREIRRAADRLQQALVGDPGGPVAIHGLYSTLPQTAQDAVLAPAPVGTRKVILATSIAESSLTIDGTRVVIDSGMARVPRFSPRSGMTRLATVRVSRASADQRRGRAGRTAPGVCYRLWHPSEDAALIPRSTPEIVEADLAPLALELAIRGVSDPAELAWLDQPPAAALKEARILLTQLGALDRDHRVTAHGRAMAEVGAHPRLAHLLLRGQAMGALPLAARLAAVLEERDCLHRPGGPPDADIRLRLELLAESSVPPLYQGHEVDRAALRRLRDVAAERERSLGGGRAVPGAAVEVDPGVLLSLAYPDRVGLRRADQAGRFLLRNGQGVRVDSPALLHVDCLVAPELDGDPRESRIWLAAPLDLADLRKVYGDQIISETILEWREPAGTLVAARQTRLGALVLAEVAIGNPDAGAVREAVLGLVRRGGLDLLGWDEDSLAMRQRLAFVHRLDPGGWPDVSDAHLLATLDDWLGPLVGSVRRRDDLRRIDLRQALLGFLDREHRHRLGELAPTHLTVPSGSSIRIDYGDPAAPALAVRLQEVFGLQATPRIGGGAVPVTLHLLSPARRPVQVTRDLAGFWARSYFEVRKELKGRYPRHDWPDDPLVAEPRRGRGGGRR
jgi:ATP-dependent helicase HrpB